MEADTASLMFLVVLGLLGILTMKVADIRGAKGPPIIWFFGGVFLFPLALPAAILKIDWQKCRESAEFLKEEALKSYRYINDPSRAFATNTMNESGVRLQTVYRDNDLLQVMLSAFNGTFASAVFLYSGRSELEAAAALVSGFPARPSDEREVRLGAPDRSYAGGSVVLRFFCADSAGRLFVEVSIESGYEHGGIYDRAKVAIPIEAAGVDRFVRELRVIAETIQGDACLPKAGLSVEKSSRIHRSDSL